MDLELEATEARRSWPTVVMGVMLPLLVVFKVGEEETISMDEA